MRQERRGPLKRMKRQIGLLTAAACLLATLAGCSAEGTAAIQPAEKTLAGLSPITEEHPSGKVAENATHELIVDADAATFALKNKATGYSWSSHIPESYYNPEDFSQTQRAGMASMLTLYYSDLKNDSRQLPAVNCTKTVSGIPGGAVFQFVFTQVGITLAVEVTLDEQGLHARIPFESIQEEGKYAVTSVELLPYFGATAANDGGYMVYPDGSGALTYFNQDKIIRDLRAKLSVYSPEQTDIDAIAQNREDGIQPLMLPVFGLARADGNAFVGMIDAGEADSTINLAFPGLLVDLYRIGTEFKYRKRYAYETAEGEEIITIDKAIIRQDCGITFVPLDGEDADYSGMAAACRRWLLDTGRMVPVSSGDQMPLALDLFMGILEERMIFNQYIGMTTFDQARAILEGLREAGADHMVVTLVGSGGKGYGVYTDRSIASDLGGKGGLKKLAAYAGECGIPLLLEQDYLQAVEGQSGFSKRSDVLYKPNGVIITDAKMTRYLLTPQVSAAQFVRDAAGWKKLGISGVRFAGMGRTVYANSAVSQILDRSQTAGYWQGILDYSRKELGFSAVQGGGQYVLRSADMLTDIPMTGSGYPYTDAYIPFYQMVVHGSIPYTGEAFNSFYDKQQQKLKAMEYGVLPYYELTYQDTALLRNTDYSDLFTSRYEDWRNEATAVYQEFSEALDGIWKAAMIRHERITDTLVRVTYDNGAVLLLNYDEAAPAQVDGVEILPLDYKVIRP